MAIEPGSEPAIVPPLVQPPAPELNPVREPAADSPALVTRPSGPGAGGRSGRPRRQGPPPSLLAALGHGARRVFSQPWLLLFVWGLGFVTAMVASSPAMVMLGMLLGKRPAAVMMARGESDFLFGELLQDHPVAVGILVASVLIASALFVFSHLVLSGGLLSALRRPGHPQRVGPALSQIVARGLLTAGAMVRLEGLFLILVRGPIVLAIAGLVALGLRSKYPDTHSLSEILGWVLPALGLALWLWCAGTVILYAVRLERLTQTAGEHSSWRALVAGVRQTFGSLAAARVSLSMALLEAVLMTALVVAGRVVAARLDYRLLVTAALLVRQGFALLRSMLTLWVMAGTVELCEPPSPTAPTAPEAAGAP